METIIILSLSLVISFFVCITIIIVSRFYFSSDKFTQIKLENFNKDVENLNIENRRLRGAVNRSKQEPSLPDSIDAGNLGEVILGLLPKKYHKMAKPFIPKVEQYIMDNPEKLKDIADKIKGVNQDGKREESANSEEIQTL
tara:strand:+ start:2533 stop:2955 length:423 start_codon:yes stop_codon:yes gene_type:complete